MMNLRDKETQDGGGDSMKATMAGPSSSSSSRQWSMFKNPRIVRVSRTFGGKDRHSKVCTIKGLRDRRIRLSVPTAVQLYDLQERLGLSQPSKVIDWLMEVTKHDIDKLPPLPIIPGSFPLFHQPYGSIQGFGAPSSSLNPFLDASLRKEVGININSDHQSMEVDDQEQSLVAKLKYWDSNVVTRLKQKGVDHHHQGGVGDQSTNASQISAQNFFPLASSTNASMLPSSSLLSNGPMFNYWEPSCLSLTQFGGIGLQGAQSNASHHHQASQLPAPASSSGSQLFLYPSSMTNPSFLPTQNSFISTSHHQQVENDLRQFNRSHLLNLLSSSSHQASNNGSDFKSFPFGLNHHPHLHQNDHERHQNKGD